MKLSKSYIKQIIMEELGKLEEYSSIGDDNVKRQQRAIARQTDPNMKSLNDDEVDSALSMQTNIQKFLKTTPNATDDDIVTAVTNLGADPKVAAKYKSGDPRTKAILARIAKPNR